MDLCPPPQFGIFYDATVYEAIKYPSSTTPPPKPETPSACCSVTMAFLHGDLPGDASCKASGALRDACSHAMRKNQDHGLDACMSIAALPGS